MLSSVICCAVADFLFAVNDLKCSEIVSLVRTTVCYISLCVFHSSAGGAMECTGVGLAVNVSEKNV